MLETTERGKGGSAEAERLELQSKQLGMGECPKLEDFLLLRRRQFSGAVLKVERRESREESVLVRVTRDTPAGADRVSCDGRKVDVRTQVLLAGVRERTG